MTLPSGFILRPARWDDAPAVLEVMDAVCRMEGDPQGAGSSVQDLRLFWETPRFDITRDAWVICDPGGRIVAYEELYDRAGHAMLSGDGYVHPEFAGRGLGTALLRRAAERAREHAALAEPDVRVFMRNGMGMTDKTAQELHANEGYRPVRYFWQMQIHMEAPPPEPQWPEGMEIRPFAPELHTRAVFEALNAAFSDHWGYVPWNYEEWRKQRLESDTFRPELWHVAWDGDRVAGASLCRYRGAGQAWVGILGVIREWRGKGLGLALLRHSFGDFYRRGDRQVGLSADAANPTGAIRLYQRAGMHTALEFVAYEKEIRPGKDIRTESPET